MTEDVYAVAYYSDGGETYYSAPVKYSILQYAMNKKNTDNQKLKKLLDNMLSYGASAQEYFEYNLDRLATDTFYQITVENGYLEDGFNKGLFKDGQEITVATDDECFSRWEDKNNNLVSTQKSFIYTITGDNILSTVSISQGLKYALINDNTGYEIRGTEPCDDVGIVIPNIYNGKPITKIGYGAFDNCSSLEKVYYLGTEQDWNNIVIDNYNQNVLTATKYYYSENYPENFAENKYWHYKDSLPKVWKRSFSVYIDVSNIQSLISNYQDFSQYVLEENETLGEKLPNPIFTDENHYEFINWYYEIGDNKYLITSDTVFKIGTGDNEEKLTTKGKIKVDMSNAGVYLASETGTYITIKPYY